MEAQAMLPGTHTHMYTHKVHTFTHVHTHKVHTFTHVHTHKVHPFTHTHTHKGADIHTHTHTHTRVGLKSPGTLKVPIGLNQHRGLAEVHTVTDCLGRESAR